MVTCVIRETATCLNDELVEFRVILVVGITLEAKSETTEVRPTHTLAEEFLLTLCIDVSEKLCCVGVGLSLITVDTVGAELIQT